MKMRSVTPFPAAARVANAPRLGGVQAIATNGLDVYVGGAFNEAGGEVSRGIAQFSLDVLFRNGFED